MNRQGDGLHTSASAIAASVQPVANAAVVASVIVPVYNGSAIIEHCLHALAHQTIAPDCYEIIVVDDGSTDAIHNTIANWCQNHPTIQCKLIRQTNQGPAAARNRGAEVAQGKLLLFTDADCRPVPHWIATFLQTFQLSVIDETSTSSTNSGVRTQSNAKTHQGDQISAAMGAYRSDQQTMAARFAQLEFEERYVYMQQQPTIDVVATYSAAFRRAAFHSVDGFDPAFPKANNEDVELSYRLSALGHRMIFAPDAIVYHPHSESWWHYAETKLGRAYWRTIVYKRYPNKALKDSYTPQILKIQIILAPLCLLGLLWFFVSQQIMALLLFVPFLLTTYPMIRFAMQQQKLPLAFWIPWGLWLRSIVFALGVIVAFIIGNKRIYKAESVLQE